MLYTRAGCVLCEDMASHVAELIEKTSHTLQLVDVDQDATLKARYGWDVPVLFDGETELCRHQLNLPLFQEWLRVHA